MYTKCLKYRAYPTKAQETKLEETLEVCRQVYNSFVLMRIVDWQSNQTHHNYYSQCQYLAVWKKSHSELTEVFSQVLQNVAARVDLAFKAFFKRCKGGEIPGYPRFKGAGQYDSITYPQKGYKVQDSEVFLSKIGSVKIVLHRPIEGKIKTCNIRRQAGKWFACFAVEVEEQPLPYSPEAVGIDVGINQFAALSDGTFIENPRFLRSEEKALSQVQRRVDKQKKGSPERQKAKKAVTRVHERIRNKRHNFIHQTARKLINQYGVIAVEKLAIKNMSRRPQPIQDEETKEFLPNSASQKAGLNKSILDAGWGMFRTVLKSKAESADRRVIEVNPAWTSQDCSGCGMRVKKKLSERVHFCPNCGITLDRDTNAAINILRNGMGQHADTG